MITFPVSVLVIIVSAATFALWRRWLGAGDTGPRSVKMVVLVLVLLALFAAGFRSWPWEWSIWGMALAALAAAGVSLWFITAHYEGDYTTDGAIKRYGPAGYGYPWAYRREDQIPELNLFGWTIVHAFGWTEVGELFLGGVTGAVLGFATVFIPFVLSLLA